MLLVGHVPLHGRQVLEVPRPLVAVEAHQTLAHLKERDLDCMIQWFFKVETNSDGRAEDVRFRTIPTPTPTGGGYVGGMVAQGVSKDCIFNEDFKYVLKFAVGAVVYELG